MRISNDQKMPCRLCGAPTYVKDVRRYKEVFIRRVRICTNPREPHKVDTFEVYAGNLDKRTLDGYGKRMRQANENKEMVKALNGAPTQELVRRTGLTEARVRQLKAATRDEAQLDLFEKAAWPFGPQKKEES